MKAAILHAADSVPVYGDFDDPVPGEGAELVDLVAAGIHQLTRSHLNAEALAKALDGDPPGLVLDFLWGSVAETAFAALAPGGPGTAPPALGGDGAGTRYVQIGALAGAAAAVPSALLRSRKITISGSGAGSVAAADIKAQIPVYIKLIAEGSVQVPFRTFLLSDVGAAWTASAEAGPRVVLVPG